jgi:hypothetical protein
MVWFSSPPLIALFEDPDLSIFLPSFATMSFAGLNLACEEAHDYEIEVDVEGERDVQSPDAWGLLSSSPASGSGELPGEEEIEAAVIRNSKEVGVGTDKEYRR